MNNEENMKTSPVTDETAPETDNRRGKRFSGRALTALVLVGVILLNVLVSLFGMKRIWQLDMTQPRFTDNEFTLYTMTDEFRGLMADVAVPAVEAVNKERADAGEDPIPVRIIFCAERDTVNNNNYARYVLYTALHLEKEFPDTFEVSFINVKRNPSAVQKYKLTSSTNIYSSNVIFEFGTEYRVYSLDHFFLKSDSASSAPWAYNGELDFSSAILAVTRAESPIAVFTTNHGEQLENIKAFRELVHRAGYIVEDIDLEKDPLPENTRLIITYDPQTDFYGYGNMGETGLSEIQKLDDFLDTACSFMLFVDDKTPPMPVLEEYMEEWGTIISRVENTETGDTDNYVVRDMTQKLDKDGYTLIGQYATTGMGSSVTTDMRSVSYPAKVVFPHATAIKRADSYSTVYVSAEESGDGTAYSYESYHRNGVSRIFSSIFTSYNTASAEVFGEQYEIATDRNLFRLMTITSEERTVQQTNYLTTDDRSFVCVCGSTEMASDALLESAVYGNTDVLVACLRYMGRAVVPVHLDLKGFKVYEIDNQYSKLTASGAIATTVWLTLIPLVVCTAAGVVINVRRKYR